MLRKGREVLPTLCWTRTHAQLWMVFWNRELYHSIPMLSKSLLSVLQRNQILQQTVFEYGL